MVDKESSMKLFFPLISLISFTLLPSSGHATPTSNNRKVESRFRSLENKVRLLEKQSRVSQKATMDVQSKIEGLTLDFGKLLTLQRNWNFQVVRVLPADPSESLYPGTVKFTPDETPAGPSETTGTYTSEGGFFLAQLGPQTQTGSYTVRGGRLFVSIKRESGDTVWISNVLEIDFSRVVLDDSNTRISTLIAVP